MLFDLRSPGRRGTIKVVYTALAVLMAGGLVLFGIGGATSGGLLDAFKSDSSSTSDIFKKRVESAEKRVEAQPRNAAAWANLAKVRYQAASAGSGFDSNTGAFTAEGKKDLVRVRQAWNRYLALDPAKPDDSVAILMVQAFGPAGLLDYDAAVQAMDIVLERREPSTGLYSQYAQLAYLAGQPRKGDLAAEKAVQLAPKDQRQQVRDALKQAKSSGSANGVQPTG